jgi:hypothetical protein
LVTIAGLAISGLLTLGCGGGGSRSGNADASTHGDARSHADASAHSDAPSGLQVPATIEYSHSLCGDIDGYRSRLLGTPGMWDPGRTFAVGLPAPAKNFTVHAIEYSFQKNAGGSAPVGLPHRAWLYTASGMTPPASGPIASWQVPGTSGDDLHLLVHLEVTQQAFPVIAAGAVPFIVIDVTPPGVTLDSLDVDQCHVDNDPTGNYLFYAPETDAPYTWTVQDPYFTHYVPDVRVIGTTGA